jgi:hypothetical protein
VSTPAGFYFNLLLQECTYLKEKKTGAAKYFGGKIKKGETEKAGKSEGKVKKEKIKLEIEVKSVK